MHSSFRKLRLQDSHRPLVFVPFCGVHRSSQALLGPRRPVSIRFAPIEFREKVDLSLHPKSSKAAATARPNSNLAAEYIAGIFRNNGLKPAGLDGKYYQNFDMYTSVLGPNERHHVQDRSAELKPEFEGSLRSSYRSHGR